MKRVLSIIIIALIIIQLNACTHNNASYSSELPKKTDTAIIPNKDSDDNQTNMKELDENGFTVYDEQSFWVNLENWGKIKFISRLCEDNKPNSRPIIKFYLVDKNQNILYQFYFETECFMFGLRDISFIDVNNDGLEDLIFIADYATGVGPTAAALLPLAGVYFQKDNEFIRDRKLDEEIWDFESIDKIVEYIGEKNIKFEQ